MVREISCRESVEGMIIGKGEIYTFMDCEFRKDKRAWYPDYYCDHSDPLTFQSCIMNRRCGMCPKEYAI